MAARLASLKHASLWGATASWEAWEAAAEALQALTGMQYNPCEPWPLYVTNQMRFLEQGLTDAACVSCYRCYFKPFLEPADVKSLDLVSNDCRCDYTASSAELESVTRGLPE